MGVNSVIQFAAYLLKENGLSSNITAVLGSNAMALMNFVVTFIGLFLVDRIGRRKLLCFGTGAAYLFYLLVPFTGLCL